MFAVAFMLAATSVDDGHVKNVMVSGGVHMESANSSSTSREISWKT